MELFAWKDKKILALKYYSGSCVGLDGVGKVPKSETGVEKFQPPDV